jgi:excisionase family DNA binding protein
VIHMSRKAAEDLLHQDHFTPRELAELLGIPRDLILHEVWSGHLKAKRLGRQVVDIRRADVVQWLHDRHEELAAPA